MGQTLKLASKESPCSSADFPAYSILCMKIRWSPLPNVRTQHYTGKLWAWMSEHTQLSV